MVVIRLDPNALRMILENDQEFALEIKAAALNTAMSHIIKAVVPGDVRRIFDSRVEQIIKEEVGYREWNKTRLKGDYEAMVSEAVRDAISRQLSEEIKRQTENFNERLDDITKSVEATVARDVRYIVQKWADEFIKKEVEARVQRALAMEKDHS